MGLRALLAVICVFSVAGPASVATEASTGVPRPPRACSAREILGLIQGAESRISRPRIAVEASSPSLSRRKGGSVPVTTPVYWRGPEGASVFWDARIGIERKHRPALKNTYVSYQIERVSTGPRRQYGFLTAHIDDADPVTLHIDLVEIEPELRGQGVQDAFYSVLAKHNPRIQKIRAQLEYVNYEAFREALFDRARAQPGFGASGSTDPWSALLRLRQEDPAGFQRLAENALLETPAYRSQKKIGFGRICQLKVEPLPEGEENLFSIHYTACK